MCHITESQYKDISSCKSSILLYELYKIQVVFSHGNLVKQITLL